MSRQSQGRVSVVSKSFRSRSGIACLATLAELLLIGIVATLAYVFMGTVAVPVPSHSPAAGSASVNAIKRLFATEDGQIWVRQGNFEIVAFNTKDQTSRSVFPWNDRPVTEFSVSNDGKTWVLAIEDREVMIFREEKLVVSEELPPELPALTAVSGNGQIVVRSNVGASFRCWDLSKGDPMICDLPLMEPAERLTLDYHGGRLLVATTQGNLQVYQTSSGKLIQSIPAVGMLSAPARFTADGDHVVTASSTEVSLYSLSSGELSWKTRFDGVSYLRELMISPDSRCIAVSGVASSLYLLDCTTGSVLRSYSDSQSFCGMSFSPEGDAVYSGRGDGSIWIWPIDHDHLRRGTTGVSMGRRLNGL